ncbi:MAG TPA: universal stress protein [Vicinamibacterales bacterium]|jgi:nucleotide-binding universal stress UspA family protein
MIEFTRILSPVDFSESSTRALAHAVALARWYQSQLTVLHVVPTFEPMQVRGDLGQPVHIAAPLTREEVVAELRRQLEVVGVVPDARFVAQAGDASSTIVDQATTGRADLVVMGTHGRRGFKRLLLGSVTETVLREAPCPVLTVPPDTRADRSQVVTFKRILCAMDFSPAALQAFGFALNLARQADGAVTLLHVVEWLAEEQPRTFGRFDLQEFRQQMIGDAEQRLHTLVEGESQTWSAIKEVILFGRPHREVLRAADADSVDLIVMGAQGRGGVDLALFGSTTQQVVRGAQCPVMTVRGAGHA